MMYIYIYIYICTCYIYVYIYIYTHTCTVLPALPPPCRALARDCRDRPPDLLPEAAESARFAGKEGGAWAWGCQQSCMAYAMNSR